MRVISGTAKGRTLKGPATSGTRPMTDRLKTSLFDTLMPYGLGGARVLDLYAGSGALGIEMLSRGAEWVDFVEHNAGVVRIIEDNLATTGLSGRARVYKMDVGAFVAMRAKAHNPSPGVVDTAADYDIILLDPPYADPAITNTLETIAAGPLLAEDGILVIGHATQVKLADEYGGGRLKRARHRVMGGSAFSIYELIAE
ncbi:MAG TPA: 16S rRNA (guanine(966)-N(2))-methyltransferase RsmD [Chloroflexia bacterium]|jgi:16S rRNA (guanine(966)-N(2))-methyltransferase RsmD